MKNYLQLFWRNPNMPNNCRLHLTIRSDILQVVQASNLRPFTTLVLIRSQASPFAICSNGTACVSKQKTMKGDGGGWMSEITQSSRRHNMETNDSFTPLPLYPVGNKHRQAMDCGLGGPQTHSWGSEDETSIVPAGYGVIIPHSSNLDSANQATQQNINQKCISQSLHVRASHIYLCLNFYFVLANGSGTATYCITNLFNPLTNNRGDSRNVHNSAMLTARILTKTGEKICM